MVVIRYLILIAESNGAQSETKGIQMEKQIEINGITVKAYLTSDKVSCFIDFIKNGKVVKTIGGAGIAQFVAPANRDAVTALYNDVNAQCVCAASKLTSNYVETLEDKIAKEENEKVANRTQDQIEKQKADMDAYYAHTDMMRKAMAV
jgi:hypothetical protein